MKCHAFVSLIALTSACAAATGSMAAGANPLVIPGIGPDMQSAQPAQARYSQRTAPQHVAAPLRTPGEPAFVPGTRGGQSQYGGGFIEMLMTGSNTPAPPRSVIYNRPPEAHQARQPQPAMRAQGIPAVQVQTHQRGPAYASLPSAGPSLNRSIDPQYMRQDVAYEGGHSAGTIIVDTPNRFLYLVTGAGRATRYGIGVGRPGFEWAGVKSITRKAEWPDWRPPPEMLKRRPDLPAFMEGGPDNPLGARAMYLGSSLYRIHGTNEPHTIGQNVSSGCIRMMNDDVVDLYNRVRVGSKVIVR